MAKFSSLIEYGSRNFVLILLGNSSKIQSAAHVVVGPICRRSHVFWRWGFGKSWSCSNLAQPFPAVPDLFWIKSSCLKQLNRCKTEPQIAKPIYIVPYRNRWPGTASIPSVTLLPMVSGCEDQNNFSAVNVARLSSSSLNPLASLASKEIAFGADMHLTAVVVDDFLILVNALFDVSSEFQVLEFGNWQSSWRRLLGNM